MLIELIGLMEGSQKAKMLGSLLRVICVLSSFGLGVSLFSEKLQMSIGISAVQLVPITPTYRCWSGSSTELILIKVDC